MWLPLGENVDIYAIAILFMVLVAPLCFCRRKLFLGPLWLREIIIGGVLVISIALASEFLLTWL